MTCRPVRDLGTVTPTAEEIVAFATQFDPQPFHLDEEAAKAIGVWCTVCQRLAHLRHGHAADGERISCCESSSLGSPGLEHIKWLKPVFPGDTLRLKRVP
jgi:acyl dehydratase